MTMPRMFQVRAHGRILFRYGWTTRGETIIETKCVGGGPGGCKGVHAVVLSTTILDDLSVMRSA